MQNTNLRGASIARTVSVLSDYMEMVDISTNAESNFERLDTAPEEPSPTATNIADLFDNFEHPDGAKWFARLIWAILIRNAWLFPDADILGRVREGWTGESYRRQYESNSKIYLQLEIYSYIDVQWQINAKMVFVAAAEDSIPELFRRTQYVNRSFHEIERFRQTVYAEEQLPADIRFERSILEYMAP
ncbi:hypothetical protein BDW74DRAFT_182014 [Aspergillus multicolor]|uniref:uncharacterized protein n=1 Tax=Aspergillus multicolor TaxID=41759 RepID=UPI003CCE53F3